MSSHEKSQKRASSALSVACARLHVLPRELPCACYSCLISAYLEATFNNSRARSVTIVSMPGFPPRSVHRPSESVQHRGSVQSKLHAHQPDVKARICEYKGQRFIGPVVDPHCAALQETMLQQQCWPPARNCAAVFPRGLTAMVVLTMASVQSLMRQATNVEVLDSGIQHLTRRDSGTGLSGCVQ